MIVRGGYFLLGEERLDGEVYGECAWTLLTDNLFVAPRFGITRLSRMPLPRWWA